MDRDHKGSCRHRCGLAELEGSIHNRGESSDRREACARKPARHLCRRYELVKGDVKERVMIKRIVAVVAVVVLVAVALPAQQDQSPEQKSAPKSQTSSSPPADQAVP